MAGASVILGADVSIADDLYYGFSAGYGIACQNHSAEAGFSIGQTGPGTPKEFP